MQDFVRSLIAACEQISAVGSGSERRPGFEADLPHRLKERGIALPDFVDRFAREVAGLYLAGEISFDHADNAIGWLHHFALMRPDGEILDEFAWNVYRAFDAGEYHPAGKECDEDLPAKYTMPMLRRLLASTAA